MANVADASTASPALVGEWGGPQVQLSLTANGGRIEFSCAATTIAAAVRPDAAGRFSANGQQEDFTGGATSADKPPPTTPTRITGTVEGDTLHLAVQRQGAAVEAYILQRGRRSKLIRCY